MFTSIIDIKNEIGVIATNFLQHNNVGNFSIDQNRYQFPTEFLLFDSSSGTIIKQLEIIQPLEILQGFDRQDVEIKYGEGRILDNQLIILYTIRNSGCVDELFFNPYDYGIRSIDLNSYAYQLIPMEFDEKVNQIKLVQMKSYSNENKVSISIRYIANNFSEQSSSEPPVLTQFLETLDYRSDEQTLTKNDELSFSFNFSECIESCLATPISTEQKLFYRYPSMLKEQKNYQVDLYNRSKLINSWNFSLENATLDFPWAPNVITGDLLIASGKTYDPAESQIERPILVIAWDQDITMVELGEIIDTSELRELSELIHKLC